MLEKFHIIAFTHKNFDVSEVGKLHIQSDSQEVKLAALKAKLNMSELMFLSTCNRVEYLFCTETPLTETYLTDFFTTLHPHSPPGLITLWPIQDCRNTQQLEQHQNRSF